MEVHQTRLNHALQIDALHTTCLQRWDHFGNGHTLPRCMMYFVLHFSTILTTVMMLSRYLALSLTKNVDVVLCCSLSATTLVVLLNSSLIFTLFAPVLSLAFVLHLGKLLRIWPFNRQKFIPESNEVETYGKSKWKHRENKRISHAQESKRLKLRNKKKIQKKLEQIGRLKQKKMQPESNETEAEDVARLLGDSKDSTTARWHRLVFSQLALFGSLSVATSWKQVVAAIAQMMVSIFDANEVQKLMDIINFQPESDETFSFEKFRDTVARARDMKASLSEIPMWKQFSRCCALLTLFGLRPSDLPIEHDVIKSAMTLWTKQIESKLGIDTIFDMVLETVSFSADFYQAYRADNLESLFRPTDLLVRGNELLAMKDSFWCGQLDLHNLTDAQYESEVELVKTAVATAISSRKMINIDSMAYRSLHTRLVGLSAVIRIRGNAGGLRVHPPVVVVYGESHVGKSSFGQALVRLAGSWLNFECSDKHIYYPAKDDAYDSGYTSHINAVFYDDMANNKPEYQTPDERGFMVRFANTIKYMSVQAELERKGRIPIDPKFCLVTTNKQDLDVFTYSNKPSSQFNRYFGVELRVKDEFCGKEPDGSKATFLDPKYEDGEINFDYHDARFFKYVQKTPSTKPGQKGKVKDTYALVTEPWTSVREFVVELRQRILHKHSSGSNYLDAIQKMRAQHVCDKCGLFPNWCECVVEEEIEVQALFSLDVANPDTINRLAFLEQIPSIGDLCSTFYEWFEWLSTVEDVAVLASIYAYLGRATQRFLDANERTYRVTGGLIFYMHDVCVSFVYTGASLFLPRIRLFAFAVQHRVLTWCVSFATGAFVYVVRFPLRILGRNRFLIVLFSPMFITCTASLVFIDIWPVARCVVWVTFFVTWCLFSVIKRIIRRTIFDIVRKDVDPALRTLSTLTYMSVGLATAYVAFKASSSLYSAFVRPVGVEGNLAPQTMDDIEARQKEPNSWLKANPQVEQFDRTTVDTMTIDQVKAKVSRNVVRVIGRTISDTIADTNALILESGLMLLPKHSFDRFDLDFPVTLRIHPNSVGGEHKVFLANPVDVSDDIVLLQFTSGPSFVSIRRLLAPKRINTNHQSVMITRTPTGTLVERTLCTKISAKSYNGLVKSHGSTHKCNEPTAKGDCMSPVIRQQKPSYVTAVHMGGNNHLSVSFSVSLDTIENAIRKMPSKFSPEGDDIVIAHAMMPEVSLERYGNSMEMDGDIHERSVVNYSQVDADGRHSKFTPIGNHPGTRFQAVSDVEISPLSRHLEEFYPRKHGKPMIRVDRNHAAVYAEASKPFDDVHPKIMDWCIRDYLAPITKELKRLEIKASVLNFDEAINGVPGTKFMKRMNMKTSSGPFLSKKKINHFTLVSTTPRNKYEAPDYIKDEFDKCLASLRSGVMDRPILKSALKDEPTKIGKEWVRVFTVSPCYNILVGRALLLPLMEYMYAIPLVTGMWQGVNCLNEEWGQLYEHLAECPRDQCLEGDYSKWDMRVSGQAIRAVAIVFETVAATLGYPLEDQEAVKTYILDCANTTMLFNGTLLSVDGYNPSGTPPTTAINGIANNLMLRCAYYVLWSQNELSRIEPFRENVRVGTLGDDSVCSTMKQWYSMVNVQRVFAEIHLPYTDGDKTGVCKRFKSLDDLTFCKRKWRWDPILEQFVAPLALDSIFKSLHCQMRSTTHPLDITIQVVDNALRELARHPQKVFEEYATYIRTAVERLGIPHSIPKLYYTQRDWQDVFLSDMLDGPDRLLGSTDIVEVEQDTTRIGYQSE